MCDPVCRDLGYLTGYSFKQVTDITRTVIRVSHAQPLPTGVQNCPSDNGRQFSAARKLITCFILKPIIEPRTSSNEKRQLKRQGKPEQRVSRQPYSRMVIHRQLETIEIRLIDINGVQRYRLWPC